MILENMELSFEKINEIIDEFSKKILENKEKSICIGLIGDLGTGKTHFTKRLLKNIGVNETVKSPTFTYMIEYNIPLIDIYHFDMYRVSDEESLYNIGYFDYIDNPNTLLIIEWADLILDNMPSKSIYFEIKHLSEDKRYISAYILDKGVKTYVDIYNYNFN